MRCTVRCCGFESRALRLAFGQESRRWEKVERRRDLCPEPALSPFSCGLLYPRRQPSPQEVGQVAPDGLHVPATLLA